MRWIKTLFSSVDGSLAKKPEVKIDPSKIKLSSTGQLRFPSLSEQLKKEIEKLSDKDKKLFIDVAIPIIAKLRRFSYEKACVETVWGESLWFSLHFVPDITVHLQVYVRPPKKVLRTFFTFWKGKIMWTNGYGKIDDCLADIQANLKE
jgi:hypothetical protein